MIPVTTPGTVVKPDPLRVAVLIGTHAVSHDLDVFQQGQVRVVSWVDGWAGILRKCGILPSNIEDLYKYKTTIFNRQFKCCIGWLIFTKI